MGKQSGGTKSTSWRDKSSGTNAELTEGATQLLAAVQSGRYRRMSDNEQERLYNNAAIESASLPLKSAEERYSSEQLKVLAYYHSSLFDDINRDLRRGGSGGKRTEVLDGMFDYTLKKPLVVYRGTETAPARGADKAFQSTSLSAAKAEYFTHGSKHLHAYKLPAGTRVIYLGGSEEEIILPRGFNLSRYKIK